MCNLLRDFLKYPVNVVSFLNVRTAIFTKVEDFYPFITLSSCLNNIFYHNLSGQRNVQAKNGRTQSGQSEKKEKV